MKCSWSEKAKREIFVHRRTDSGRFVSVCDGTQNVGRYRYRYFFPVLNIFDTDTGTFYGTKFSRYRFRDFFPVPNFSDTGSDTTIKMKNSRYRYLYGTGTHYKSLKFLNFGNETQFRYQIFPIPVPRLFSGTKFCRYRFRDFLSVPNLTDTGSETFFRYQFVPIPVPIPPKKLKIPGTGNSRYRYVTLWSSHQADLQRTEIESPPLAALSEFV